MRAVFLESITDIDANAWNAALEDNYPFMRHQFLAAMELSESASTNTGWQPQHLLIYDQNTLVAVMPLYLKAHSYGEYVFDWSWASAYDRYGLPYYPKLLSAIPFTPATGPRLAIVNGIDNITLTTFVAETLRSRAKQRQASSIHILLTDDSEAQRWHDVGLPKRTSVQYHWINKGYCDFDDFLASFSSRKRKNLKKERRRVSDQGITLTQHIGSAISEDLWDVFYDFYQLTYAKRSGHGGYLRRDFFSRLSQSMPDQIMMVLAEHQSKYVAGALYFYGDTTLYGRYWGCTHEFDMLHFEACYYQGIEFCIAKGLTKFDPGAQGEHKIQRGFTPTTTWSNHWIADAQFRHAIYDFIEREAQSNQAYLEEARQYLPFKKDTESAT